MWLLFESEFDGVCVIVSFIVSLLFKGVEKETVECCCSGWWFCWCGECSYAPANGNGGWDWTGVWDDLNEIITVDWVSVVADVVLLVEAEVVYVGRAADCKVGKCLESVEAEK